ncbi:hypothetical protein WJX84_008872 [Apatococcus fuscideae]|uniref:S-formylglutathione hydrolase n=1 Tax=Apatococcus fuscideae TaxID=2026836 RepID=A0AAW1T5A6_9CHLO
MAASEQSANKQFGGWNRRYTHDSQVLGCSMTFTVYFPPAAEEGSVPVLYFLSGLTCDDQNFITKAGAQRKASELGIALVSPDTSPRADVPGENDKMEVGSAAGFYLNATEGKWKKNYQMYDYIVKELPSVLKGLKGLQIEKASIMGHSMGGHGALIIGLRNPDKYAAISAFAPISNPSTTPMGSTALAAYLGDDKSAWKQYDATEVAKSYHGPSKKILIDQGTSDNFWKENLKPENFKEAAPKELSVELRHQDGYNHSYFFISTFVEDHVAFHAAQLQ